MHFLKCLLVYLWCFESQFNYIRIINRGLLLKIGIMFIVITIFFYYVCHHFAVWKEHCLSFALAYCRQKFVWKEKYLFCAILSFFLFAFSHWGWTFILYIHTVEQKQRVIILHIILNTFYVSHIQMKEDFIIIISWKWKNNDHFCGKDFF
jgi:hypothetical protein